MYRTVFQRGFLTVFFSIGSKPLDMWEVHVQNGYITKLLDPEIKSTVLDIRGINVSTSYISCPSNNRILGITLPFMIMIVKNLKKWFTFEVTILDDSGAKRRFRVSNFQSRTQISPFSTVMPIGLADGWNQIQFNLSEFTRRAYNKSFVEVQGIKVNANIRLRRIYFADKLIPEDDLPPEYRIFLPMPGKAKKTAEPEKKESTVLKAPSKQIVTSKSQIKPKPVSMASIVEIPQTVPSLDAGSSGEEENPPLSPPEAAARGDQKRTSTADELPAPGEITSAADEPPAPGEITPATDEPPATGETTPVADAATTTTVETASVGANTTES